MTERLWDHVVGVRLRKIWLAIMVAERGSFSDAAAAMGISQSAASRAIESLEIELQCALFERRGHSVKATRQGEILLFRAKRAREQLRRAASEFGETRAEAVFGDMMRASDHEYRAFIAVYNQTTVSQAAFSLGIKQPSISRSLSRLELRLKQVLFERRSFELRATQIGRKLVVPFKLMFRELDQAREEIKLNLGNRKGQVVLGCLPPTRARLVPDAILALISEYPDVNVRVIDGIFPALFAMLMHGEMDILVGTLRNPLPEGTNAEFLLYDRVSIVVRPEHPLARQDVVTLEDCLQYDWVLPNSSAPLRQFFNKVLQSHGFNSPERYTEVDSDHCRTVLTLQQRQDRNPFLFSRGARGALGAAFDAAVAPARRRTEIWHPDKSRLPADTFRRRIHRSASGQSRNSCSRT